MKEQKGKVGINTYYIVFLLCCFSPAVRMFGTYVSNKAKQAGWLSPLVASLVFYYLVTKLYYLLANNPGLSLIEVYEKAIGKVLAKVISVIYLVWIVYYIGNSLRFYSFRLTTILYTNITEKLFITIALIIIGPLFLKSGLVIFSRTFQVFHWITLFSLVLLISMLVPNISIDKLTPISYLDIIPIIQGSTAIISVYSMITMMAIYSDDIIGIKEFKKKGLQTSIYLFVIVTVMIMSMIGVLGNYLLSAVSFPFLIAVEQIVIFHSIHGFESLLTVLWVMSDIALVTLSSFSALKLIKYIFNLKNTSVFVNIFMLLAFFFSTVISNNYFELTEFANRYGYFIQIALFLLVPILISWLYKIRNKALHALFNSKKQA